MLDCEELDVKLRAYYEHFKSRPGKRKIYTTLGFRAVEGSVDVMYIADYDPDRIYYRDIEDFTDMVLVEDQVMPRFTLLEEGIITVQERDRMLDELYEDN